MDNTLLLISAGIMLITLLFSVTRQFHILQLNSYYNSRFIAYLRGEFKRKTVCSAVCCAAVTLLAFFSPLSVLIITAATCPIRIWYTLFKMKTAKKRLVFTARIKRMYITLSAVSAVLFALGAFNIMPPHSQAVLSSLLLFCSPFAAMGVNLLNAPLEGALRRKYINDAKHILAGMPSLKVIGLTGSYGKTSTKYILGRLLSEKYNTLITPGSFNTPLGVVRTIRERMAPQTQVFIVEMGAKKTGDIKELCDIVHPTAGIITSVGMQHLDTFGSLDNIINTKFELADAVNAAGGMMYLNLDNEYIRDKSGYAHIGCGVKNGAVRAENISCGRNGLAFDICAFNRRIPVETRLLGRHNVLNIVMAAAVAVDMGLSDDEIAYAVGRLEPVEHRLEMKPFLNGSLLIDDAYNANPEGSLEALSVLGSFAPMKRIVVTPGLVELGECEYECNKALGMSCAEYADEIILVGRQRSKPIADGVSERGFDKNKVHTVDAFTDAAKLLEGLCDRDTVVLFENDLPDNYAK